MTPKSHGPTSLQTERAVLMVSFPHQLLHALSALKYDRACRGIAMNSPALLVLWSFQAHDHQPDSKVRQFFAAALQDYPFITPLVFSLKERAGPLSPYRKVMARARWLEQRLGASTRCSTFYYAHDASSDHTPQAFMQALKADRIVCYGDAPGFLYPSVRPARPTLGFNLRSVKEVFWQNRVRDVDTWLAADTALIAINFGDQENGLPFPKPSVIPAETVIQTLQLLKRAFPEIKAFEASVLQTAPHRKSALLILSNFTNSRLISRRNELALYIDICRTYLRPGESLFIKKHAGTHPTFVTQLANALSEYQTQLFPPHLEHLPIELFTSLHTHCKVISVSSASSLLALIPGNHAIHALTQQHIEKLFSPTKRLYMNTANNRILQRSHSSI